MTSPGRKVDWLRDRRDEGRGAAPGHACQAGSAIGHRRRGRLSRSQSGRTLTRRLRGECPAQGSTSRVAEPSAGLSSNGSLLKRNESRVRLPAARLAIAETIVVQISETDFY